MREKNTLLTLKDPRTNEIIVIRPVTSIGNIEGLKNYIERKLDLFLKKLKEIFVEQETGKSLSTNDFSDKYKAQLDNLKTENVTNITVNGQTVQAIDGTVEITTETVAPAMSVEEIEDIFNSI